MDCRKMSLEKQKQASIPVSMSNIELNRSVVELKKNYDQFSSNYIRSLFLNRNYLIFRLTFLLVFHEINMH